MALEENGFVWLKAGGVGGKIRSNLACGEKGKMRADCKFVYSILVRAAVDPATLSNSKYKGITWYFNSAVRGKLVGSPLQSKIL